MLDKVVPKKRAIRSINREDGLTKTVQDGNKVGIGLTHPESIMYKAKNSNR